MEGIKLRGIFRMKLVDKNGKVFREYEDNNLVVDLGRTNMVNLLGGATGGVIISEIGVGTSSTAPTNSDTGLTGAFTKNLNTGSGQANSYTPNTVTFQYQFDTTDANGMTIWEFGLFNSNGVLCARKTLSTSIVKTSSFAIVGSWTLTIN